MARVTHLNVNHRGSDGATMNADDIPFTPNGSIASTNVQAAIQEVRDEASGGSGPFEDVDTFAWRFISPANALYASDDSSYIFWDTDGLFLWANYVSVDISGSAITLTADEGLVIPVLTGDPTGAAGGLYYNSNTERFRAKQNGVWVDLVRGALTSRTSAAAIANTETVVASFSLLADTMEAGTTFRVKAYGRLTSGATGGSSIFRCRIGTTTLTGNIPATLTVANGALVTDGPFTVEMLVTVRTAGASGTAIGNIKALGGVIGAFTVAGAISAISGTVTVDTTADKLIEFTYISGNAGTTATFENAVIELLR